MAHIKLKNRELAELQEPVSALRSKKEALDITYSKYTNSTFDSVAGVSGCITLFLAWAVAAGVFAALGYSASKGIDLVWDSISVLIAIVVVLPPIWVISRICYPILYRKNITQPKMAIEEQLGDRERELEPISSALEKNIEWLNLNLRKCKEREYI